MQTRRHRFRPVSRNFSNPSHQNLRVQGCGGVRFAGHFSELTAHLVLLDPRRRIVQGAQLSLNGGCRAGARTWRRSCGCGCGRTWPRICRSSCCRWSTITSPAPGGPSRRHPSTLKSNPDSPDQRRLIVIDN